MLSNRGKIEFGETQSTPLSEEVAKGQLLFGSERNEHRATAVENPHFDREGTQLLHEIFEAQADNQPGTAAVVFGRDQATYAELDALANRISRHLRSRGIGRGSLVAMLLPRSIGAYASILGILKAGAAYVPLDPACPPNRVVSI